MGSADLITIITKQMSQWRPSENGWQNSRSTQGDVFTCGNVIERLCTKNAVIAWPILKRHKVRWEGTSANKIQICRAERMQFAVIVKTEEKNTKHSLLLRDGKERRHNFWLDTAEPLLVPTAAALFKNESNKLRFGTNRQK